MEKKEKESSDENCGEEENGDPLNSDITEPRDQLQCMVKSIPIIDKICRRSKRNFEQNGELQNSFDQLKGMLGQTKEHLEAMDKRLPDNMGTSVNSIKGIGMRSRRWDK